jgi:hypothetical protein
VSFLIHQYSVVSRIGSNPEDVENLLLPTQQRGWASQYTIDRINQLSPKDSARLSNSRVSYGSAAINQTPPYINQYPGGPTMVGEYSPFTNHGTEHMQLEGYGEQKRQAALGENRLVDFGNLANDVEDSHLRQLLRYYTFDLVGVWVYSYSVNENSYSFGLDEFINVEPARQVINHFEKGVFHDKYLTVRVALPSDGLPIVARLQTAINANSYFPVSSHSQFPSRSDEFNPQFHRGNMGGLGANATISLHDTADIPYRVHVGGLAENCERNYVNYIFRNVENKVKRWGPPMNWRQVERLMLLTGFAEFSTKQEAEEILESYCHNRDYAHLTFWLGPAAPPGL